MGLVREEPEAETTGALVREGTFLYCPPKIRVLQIRPQLHRFNNTNHQQHHPPPVQHPQTAIMPDLALNSPSVTGKRWEASVRAPAPP